MASAYEDIVRGKIGGGYSESVKKTCGGNSDYAKCRGCPNISDKCPKPECFKNKEKKKK